MKSIRFLALTLAFMLMPPFGVVAQAGEVSQLSDHQARLLFRDFREIKSFGILAVSLVGDAEKIGLNEADLTDCVKAAFKDYFPGIKYEDISTDPEKFMALAASREKKIGNITFRVWVVGEDQPVAYHVRCDAGNFDNPAVRTDETLGHGSRKTAPDAIREVINEMMKSLSVDFFRVRAEAKE